MEKTLESRTPTATATSGNPTTSEKPASLIKCVRCDQFFTPAKVLSGVYRSWLARYCDKCALIIEAEWKKEEDERVTDVRAREATSRENRKRDAQIAACGGLDPYQRYKFENYQPELHPAYRAWYQYAKKFPIEAKNLFVYGPTGVGKTHNTVAMGRMLWEKGGTFRWIHVDELIAEVFGTGRVSKMEKLERIDAFAKIDCLAIDELHTIDNQRHIDALQMLFDKRQRMGKFGLVTIANVSLKGLADIVHMPLADRMDDRTFEIYCIPENTPSARGILRRAAKSEK